MMRIRPEAIEKEEDDAFGDPPQQDITFLLVPMSTYRLCAERAKIDGCTAAQVFERAILQYLRPVKNDVDDSPTKEEPQSEPPETEPDIVVRRNRR